jgi:hypothetical protein
MKPRFHWLLLAVALATTVGVLACNDDDNPMTPTTGSIAGTITFQGTWPSSGQVQVSVFANFPPTGPPDAFTNPIAPAATYNYRFDGLDPASYAAVVIGWLDPNLPPGSEEILGMYWAYVDSVAVDGSGNPRGLPRSVTVQAGKTASNIDMMADLDVAP